MSSTFFVTREMFFVCVCIYKGEELRVFVRNDGALCAPSLATACPTHQRAARPSPAQDRRAVLPLEALPLPLPWPQSPLNGDAAAGARRQQHQYAL